jgi:hypothetical protein
MKWLKDRVGEKRIVYKANTMIGLAEAAAGGMGMALLPCYVGAAVPGLAQLSPPLPELEGELWLITHPDLRNTARVRAFLDFCTGEIAQRRRIIECSDWKDQFAPRSATVVASDDGGLGDGGSELVPATFTRRVKSQ